jgi:hypothetical protein
MLEISYFIYPVGTGGAKASPDGRILAVSNDGYYFNSFNIEFPIAVLRPYDKALLLGVVFYMENCLRVACSSSRLRIFARVYLLFELYIPFFIFTRLNQLKLKIMYLFLFFIRNCLFLKYSVKVSFPFNVGSLLWSTEKTRLFENINIYEF